MTEPQQSRGTPLCVDLDGTLVRTDTFAESILLALRASPVRALRALLLLFRSRAQCKRAMSRLGRPDPRVLPYNTTLIDYIRTERAAGRRVLLVTGADEFIARGVANHLNLFDAVLASDGIQNLTRENKARAIQVHLNGSGYAYAGDSRDDFPIWHRAESAIVAGNCGAFEAKLASMGTPVERSFPRSEGTLLALVRLIRPQQWAKNLLIVVPLFLSHRLFDPSLWAPIFKAFFAFSFCASALYVWNDLLDIQADRVHPRKRSRPLAAAAVSIPAAGLALVSLLGASLLLSASLPPDCWIILIAYACASASYSLYVKRLVILDVVVLAGLYTLRIYYGGAASGITISVWTTAFSVFVFVALALLKRLAELRTMEPHGGVELAGRGYRQQDLPVLASLASAASYLATLVLGLYIQSPEVQLLYRKPLYLWMMVPLLIYWLSRALLLANRGEIDDDPLLFALRDPASYWVGLGCAGVVLIASRA